MAAESNESKIEVGLAHASEDEVRRCSVDSVEQQKCKKII